MTSETYVFGQLARALIAHADGDAAEASRAVQAVLAFQPAWVWVYLLPYLLGPIAMGMVRAA